MKGLLLFSIAAAISGCAGDFDIDKQTYPCRAASDCVKGYECHPTRFICVLSGTDAGAASDGGAGRDAGR
jgi:hypothetical protein